MPIQYLHLQPTRRNLSDIAMSSIATGALIFGLVMFLMALGIPVAFSFLVANLIGAFLLMGGIDGLLQLVDNSTSLITTFTLVAIPMFVLMGTLLFHSGLALRVFDALDTLFGRIPARLSYLTVAGGTTFSTLTGSTMANTAMLGSLMVPEMKRRGYAPYMAIGPIIVEFVGQVAALADLVEVKLLWQLTQNVGRDFVDEVVTAYASTDVTCGGKIKSN